jgi:cellulose synthase/poly-beta-1,6-N-acetylglucosamine synthase-like glycosyltransferase
MVFKFPKASIVVATYNNKNVLRKVLRGMLRLDYPAGYEVIVVDDGSRDGTAEMVRQEFKAEKKIRFFGFGKNKGVCKARNKGIRMARYPVVANMDHDCIPARAWLKDLVKPFADPKVGAASSFGAFGGTSTAFRKKLLDRVGGYDEDYFYYREDTDLTFKIIELGYMFKKTRAHYVHDHREIKPKGLVQLLGYVLKRLRYHENDALLYKKHPGLAGRFLKVKLGFLVSPKADFSVVANLWQGSDKKLKLCSPRGIVLIRNKSPVHALAIVFLAGIYVLMVKFFRLVGSVRFGKLLV